MMAWPGCCSALGRSRQSGRRILLEHQILAHRRAEFVAVSPVDAGAARQTDADRIDRSSVARHFIMQMRSARQAGRSDEADDLPLAHMLSGNGDDPAHVRVTGGDAAGMNQLDLLAVAPAPAGRRHPAVGGSPFGLGS